MPEQNYYLCPEGKPLKYVGINKLNRVHTYHSTAKRCRGCAQKPQCTRGKYRIVSIHVCEAARQKAYEIAKTPQFAEALREAAESGSAVLGTEEPDRVATFAPAQDQVRTRTVLLGCSGTEPETAGAVPQYETRSRGRKGVETSTSKKTNRKKLPRRENQT